MGKFCPSRWRTVENVISRKVVRYMRLTTRNYKRELERNVSIFEISHHSTIIQNSK